MSRLAGIWIFGIAFTLWGILCLAGAAVMPLGARQLQTMSVEQRARLGQRILQRMTAGERARLGPEQQRKLVQGDTVEVSRSSPIYSRILLVLGLIFLAIGIGVLMLRRWARWLALIFSGISILSQTSVFAARGKLPVGPSGWLSLAFAGLALWYFLRPSVKAQFQSARSRS